MTTHPGIREKAQRSRACGPWPAACLDGAARHAPPPRRDRARRRPFVGARRLPGSHLGRAGSYTNARRGWGDVDFVVIHTCEGGFSGCYGWQLGCHDVSAHYTVSTTGQVVQVVADEDIAWHVGCLNSSSFGIEHAAATTAPTPAA